MTRCGFHRHTRVDVLERLMRLEAEELSKLVEGSTVPVACLLHAENLHRFQRLRDMIGAE